MKASIKQKVRHGTVRKIIETPSIIAIMEVPVIFVPEMGDEPLLNPAAIKLIDEAHKRARAGDRQWLKKHGAKVYVSAPAA